VLAHNICVLVLAMQELGIEANFGSEIPFEPKLPAYSLDQNT
jgi:hypothetical protein